MINNIFENLTDEEQNNQWVYMIFNRDKILEKTEEWTKEAEKRGMTLTEYLESINPLNEANKIDAIKDISAESESREKKMQKYERKQLIDELSKMPSMVIETAYLYAVNYVRYGEDVTEKWMTATQNASILEKAYRKGYYNALQRRAESEE